MTRALSLSILAVVLLVTPVAADGLKIGSGGLMPAHAPFGAATRPLPAHAPFGSAVIPGAPATTPPGSLPQKPHRPHRPLPVVVAPFVGAGPQVVYIVNQTITVAAAPSVCETAGYWAYQWTPYQSTQNVWVEGSWASDGTWVDSRYEPRAYMSGYYQPFWVPGERYPC